MIRALKLQNIRSYKSGLFEFEDGVNIVVGPNASGKTNLLEALYMAAQGSGFKSVDSDMMAYDSEWARIDATTDSGARVVKLKAEPFAKTFEIEELQKKRLGDRDRLPVVLFEPNHMLLLGGEPERRRSYVDGILSQAEPGYKKLLNDYKRVVSQRNRLLKQEHVASDHLFAWDVRLSELGGQVAEKRLAYIQIVDEKITSHYRAVSGNKESLRVRYESKLPLKSYSQALLNKLKADFELDVARGFTGAGPHRDDVAVTIDSAEARLAASRGETRSIVLALKMSELELIAERAEIAPMLLLDDVFSELDGKRRRKLAEALKGTQTFITTTDADAIVKSFMQRYNVIALSS